MNLSLLSRLAAASIGGYLLTALVSLALLLCLPVEPQNARYGATLASFPLWTALIVRVFACVSAGRAWLELGVAGLLLAGLCAGLLGGAP